MCDLYNRTVYDHIYKRKYVNTLIQCLVLHTNNTHAIVDVNCRLLSKHGLVTNFEAFLFLFNSYKSK